MRINPALNKWKYLGNTSGTGSINLPTSFNELMCYVKVSDNNNVIIPILILKDYLTTTEVGFNGGYGGIQGSGGVSAAARVVAKSTTAKLGSCYLNNSSVSNSTCKYYYR